MKVTRTGYLNRKNFIHIFVMLKIMKSIYTYKIMYKLDMKSKIRLRS